MGWIIFSVLLMGVFWVGIGLWIYARNRDKKLAAAGMESSSSDLMPPIIGGGIAALAAAAWVLLTFFFMLHTVGQREVAIVYNFSGTIAGRKDPGIVTTWPWQHVRKENVGIQHEEFLFDQANSAVSLDQQQIFGTLAVNFQIDSENVVDLYRRVGPSWKTIIINSRVPQVFKEVTATYQTVEITEKREGLRKQTRDRLTSELEPYDIKVVDVFITNLGFSETYRLAIEAKQKQVQEAAQARARIGQVVAEKKQKIIAAQGDAAANRLRRNSLSPILVQWEAIQRLNPNVQMIICPPASVCIPNAGNTVIPTPKVGP